MTDTERIRAEVAERGIHRLCHFTPSRNLAHMLSNGHGILASSHLRDDERAVFNPTDLKRWDGHRNHVCCSIEFPNAWFFRSARGAEQLFPDWVVLYLDPHYLWEQGTKFSPSNASRDCGAHVAEGLDAFRGLFAACVEGKESFVRGEAHPSYLPTDQQAEVLVPDRVPRTDILGVAVRDEGQAKRETARWGILPVEGPPVVIVPEFYHPNRLSSLLLAGHRPDERLWDAGTES